jgi:hypothetical protein
LAFLTDLCHVQSARAAGEVGRVCAELVHGYNRHPAWTGDGCDSCAEADSLETLDIWIPGISGPRRDNGSHATKAGPCARFDGVEAFVHLRTRLDGCLTGSQLAKDRAAEALTKVMIPEVLDYPA